MAFWRWQSARNLADAIGSVFYCILKITGDPLDYVRKSKGPYAGLLITDLSRNGGSPVNHWLALIWSPAIYKHQISAA